MTPLVPLPVLILGGGARNPRNCVILQPLHKTASIWKGTFYLHYSACKKCASSRAPFLPAARPLLFSGLNCEKDCGRDAGAHRHLHSPLPPGHTPKLHFPASLTVKWGLVIGLCTVEHEQKWWGPLTDLTHKSPYVILSLFPTRWLHGEDTRDPTRVKPQDEKAWITPEVPHPVYHQMRSKLTHYVKSLRLFVLPSNSEARVISVSFLIQESLCPISQAQFSSDSYLGSPESPTAKPAWL